MSETNEVITEQGEVISDLAIFTIYDDINGETLSNLIQAIEPNIYFNSQTIVKIYINSYGGCCAAAFGMCDYIRSLVKRGFTVQTIVIGNCMSAAVPVACCGSERYAGQYARFMIHPVTTDLTGDAKVLQNDVRETKTIQALYNKILLDNTKISRDHLSQIMKPRADSYFGTALAIKLGIIDKQLGE